MRLQKTVAGAIASAMILSGAVLGASAAQADDSLEYVAGGAISATTAETEATLYNQWHFDPSKSQTVTPQRNGILVPAGPDVAVLKGNGNNTAPVPEGGSAAVGELANSLAVVTSDANAVWYQIPVFFGEGGFTTLRKKASTTGVDTKWTTSKAIGAVKANATAEISTLVEALTAETNARAIGAGFFVAKPQADVLVSAFEASGTLTRFYEQPTLAEPGAATTSFLDAKDIRPNEETYPGWHQGVTDATGTFTTLTNDKGTATGLQMTEKSQLLNGFAPEAFLQNAAAFAAGMQIEVASSDEGVWAQMPIFYYRDSVVGAKFATIRALVPASGKLIDATEWVSSADIGTQDAVGVAKNTPVSFETMMAAVGDHEVLGYGVYQDGGTSVLQSITFNGQTTEFFKTDKVDPVDPGPKPKPLPKLTDVAKGDKFYADIMWMQERGITTGNKKVAPNGKVTYAFLPKDSVTREAMAAFMYRAAAPKGYVAPKVSPFADMKPGDKFYKEISWMYDTKRAKGTAQPSGKAKFLPKDKISREAVAAFLYREAQTKGYQAPKASPFADVKPSDKFYKEMAWMLETKRSTGIKQPSGKPKYDAKANLSREAMAAFLHRTDKLK